MAIKDRWPYPLVQADIGEIRFAVSFEDWQRKRRQLKGISTLDKLRQLEAWLLREAPRNPSRRTLVQVSNYINALKRGGQLTVEGVIQK